MPQNIKSIWENISHLWALVVCDENCERNNIIYPTILKLIGTIKKQRILDVGCGEGQFCRLLSKKQAKVIGLDVSSSMIEYAQKYNSKEALSIEYFSSNAEKLSSIINEPIDIITMIMSLMCIEDAQKTLNECGKILKENGKLLFAILHPCFVNSFNINQTSNSNKKENIETYLQEHLFYMDILNSPEIPIFHRPLSSYSQWLADSNLYINRIIELSPSESLKKNTLYNPLYLIVECIKNTSL